MILGIDVGNFATKTSTGCIFESKVAKVGNILSNDITLEMNREVYYLGEGNFDTGYRKAYKDSYLQLFFGAAALSSEDLENQVVVGLPLSQYKQDKEILKKIILDNRYQQITINHTKKILIITDAEVYPEGLGAVPKEFEGIVIDIGGRTTDIALLVKGNSVKKVENPISLPQGTLNLESDFIKTINSKYSLDLKIKDAKRILKNGLKIYGEEVDINFAIEIYKQYVEDLINKVQLEYSLKTYDVALVGGGSRLLYTPLKRRLPNSFLVENSVFANANAFRKVGENLWP